MDERKIIRVQRYQRGQVWMVREDEAISKAKINSDCNLMAKTRPYVIISDNEFLRTRPDFIQGYPLTTSVHNEDGKYGPYITIENLSGCREQIVIRELKTFEVASILTYQFSIPEEIMDEVDAYTSQKLGMFRFPRSLMNQLAQVYEGFGMIVNSRPEPKSIPVETVATPSKEAGALAEFISSEEPPIRIPPDVTGIQPTVVNEVITALNPTEWKFFQKNAITQLMESNRKHVIYQKGYCKNGKSAGCIEVIYYDHNPKNRTESPKFVFPNAFVRIAVREGFRKQGIARLMISELFDTIEKNEQFQDIQLNFFYNPDVCSFGKFAVRFGFMPERVKIDRCQLYKFTGKRSDFIIKKKEPVEKKNKPNGTVHTIYSDGSTTLPSKRIRWTDELMASFISDCDSMTKDAVASKWHISVDQIYSRKHYCNKTLNAKKSGGGCV